MGVGARKCREKLSTIFLLPFISIFPVPSASNHLYPPSVLYLKDLTPVQSLSSIHTRSTFSLSTIYQKNIEIKKQILFAFLLPHQVTPSLTFDVESRDEPINLQRKIQRSNEKLEKKEKHKMDDTFSKMMLGTEEVKSIVWENLSLKY